MKLNRICAPVVSLIFGIVVSVCCSDRCCAEDWPQFRGPNWSASSEDAGPVKWSDEENVLWKCPLPGRGSSSPIVVGDRVFLTAFTGYGLTANDPGEKSDLRLHVICIDKKSGEVLWDKSIAGSENTQDAKSRVVDHGFSSATPASDGEAVYASFGVSGIVAYTIQGELMWQAEIGTNTAGFGSASSPTMFENLLLVNASIESNSVFAFDKKTGKEVWKIEDFKRSWTMPAIGTAKDGSPELVLNEKDTIRGFDPRTGKELWHCTGIDDYIVPVPVFHDGIVYCPGGRSNRFIAIRLGGRGDVTGSHKLWEIPIGANVTSPVYHDGHLYWASDKGIANCVRASDGETVYRERMPTDNRVYASIIRGGDYLYLTMRDTGVLVLKAQPEYNEVAINKLKSIDSMVNATPAISDGKLYLRSDTHLYCIGAN